MSGDPGELSHLTDPAWVRAVRAREHHARAPVRVADAKKAGAVKDEAARKALLARIASGKSSIAFDFSNRAVSPSRVNEPSAQEVLKRNDELLKQYTAYLEELSKTPAGLQLLTELDKAKHKTTIVFDYTHGSRTTSEGDHASDKKGEPAMISLNPGDKTFDHREKAAPAWATEREKYGMYHELVHAWHITRGTQATGSHSVTRNSEWQATGLGPWAKEPMSENVIRSQMGKAPRPDYGLRTYD